MWSVVSCSAVIITCGQLSLTYLDRVTVSQVCYHLCGHLSLTYLDQESRWVRCVITCVVICHWPTSIGSQWVRCIITCVVSCHWSTGIKSHGGSGVLSLVWSVVIDLPGSRVTRGSLCMANYRVPWVKCSVTLYDPLSPLLCLYVCILWFLISDFHFRVKDCRRRTGSTVAKACLYLCLAVW